MSADSETHSHCTAAAPPRASLSWTGKCASSARPCWVNLDNCMALLFRGPVLIDAWAKTRSTTIRPQTAFRLRHKYANPCSRILINTWCAILSSLTRSASFGPMHPPFLSSRRLTVTSISLHARQSWAADARNVPDLLRVRQSFRDPLQRRLVCGVFRDGPGIATCFALHAQIISTA